MLSDSEDVTEKDKGPSALKMVKAEALAKTNKVKVIQKAVEAKTVPQKP